MYFLHTLALALGYTVGELLERLTPGELEGWRAYARLFPFDDLHRYHRPAALIAQHASTKGGDLKKLLDFLQPRPQPRATKLVQVIKPKG